ncbi:inositol monophosphatase family protein [Micromonospora lupini]|uniref:inositol monophosphatase family protein n=1 Tax=Micromonospora lupini TaxID=285679 RepID=UPI0031E1155B
MAEVAPWSIHAALLVARGQLDLTVQVRGQVWDYAATSLIVEEAGGRFSALDGQPRSTPGPALFARNTALHTRALQILTATAPPHRSTEASHRR